MAKIDEWLQDDKLILLEGWARDGLTDEQIMKNMGIQSKSTFYGYKKDYPNFSNALKRGKEVVDFEVENALLKKALGYTITLHKQKVTKDGDVIDIEEDMHVPPDTTAQIYWLKNRKPDKWRDKVVDSENEEAITNASDILVKIRKTVDDRYERN